MFTWVKPHESFLRDECKHLDGWQTKDVIVDHQLQTLEITEDGQLVYVWHEWEYVEDASSLWGGRLVPTVEHRNVINYHGVMRFYTSDKNTDEWFEFEAKFTDGVLFGVKRVREQ